MNYINFENKNLVTADNGYRANPFIVDYNTEESVSFQVLNHTLNTQASYYFAGGTKNYSTVIFLSDTYTISNNVITFTVDTYTQQYLDNIKRKNTPINIQIGYTYGDQKIILLRDTAVANPRVYQQGVSPTVLQLNCYTKAQMNSILNTNYWTKQETASAIANIQTMKIVVVQELPPIAEAEEYTIYLVPATNVEQSNVYNEYLVINGAFQLIGSTAVDLTQYANLSSNNTFTGNNTFSNGNVVIDTPTGDNPLTIKHGSATRFFIGQFGQRIGCGHNCTVSGSYGSFALGYDVSATGGGGCVSFGTGITNARAGTLVIGQYNVAPVNEVFVIGNGADKNNKNNCFTVDNTGNVTANGVLTVSNGNNLGSTISPNGHMAVGNNVTTNAHTGSIVSGSNNNAQYNNCSVFGAGNTTYANNQTVIGTYSTNDADSYFIVGNGTSSNDKSNAFTVKKTGDVIVNGNVQSNGQKINTLTSNSFAPIDNQVFKYTLSADTSFTIDTTDLTANNQINFELHLKQGSTAYTPSFTNTIIWGDGDVFDSSNTMPTMTDTNTVYVLIFRWDGEDLLCNLAYKKVVAQ